MGLWAHWHLLVQQDASQSRGSAPEGLIDEAVTFGHLTGQLNNAKCLSDGVDVPNLDIDI